MKQAIVAIFQSFLVLGFVDFLAGIVHWAEDAYIREDTPLIGSSIGRANVIHHHLPRYMTRMTWWQSSWDLVLFSITVVLGAWALGMLTWQVWLFAVLSANANEVHKWSHRTRRENGRVISFLQAIRLIQTPRHHGVHHTNPKNVRYCPVTNLLNPVLDGIGFWSGLEWLLERTIGLRRRPDTSLPENGPTPNWVRDLRDASRPARG